MNNLSIEELKKMRSSLALTEGKMILSVLDELIAIRELKGEQVPVAIVEHSDYINFGEKRKKAVRELYEGALVIGQELFTAPQKPVVVLTDCDIGAVSHMAHWYSEEQCEAWVAGVEHAKKQIVAAGGIVKDGE